MNLDDGKETVDLITVGVLLNEGATVGDIYDMSDDTFSAAFISASDIFSNH